MKHIRNKKEKLENASLQYKEFDEKMQIKYNKFYKQIRIG